MDSEITERTTELCSLTVNKSTVEVDCEHHWSQKTIPLPLPLLENTSQQKIEHQGCKKKGGVRGEEEEEERQRGGPLLWCPCFSSHAPPCGRTVRCWDARLCQHLQEPDITERFKRRRLFHLHQLVSTASLTSGRLLTQWEIRSLHLIRNNLLEEQVSSKMNITCDKFVLNCDSHFSLTGGTFGFKWWTFGRIRMFCWISVMNWEAWCVLETPSSPFLSSPHLSSPSRYRPSSHFFFLALPWSELIILIRDKHFQTKSSSGELKTSTTAFSYE